MATALKAGDWVRFTQTDVPVTTADFREAGFETHLPFRIERAEWLYGEWFYFLRPHYPERSPWLELDGTFAFPAYWFVPAPAPRLSFEETDPWT